MTRPEDIIGYVALVEYTKKDPTGQYYIRGKSANVQRRVNISKAAYDNIIKGYTIQEAQLEEDGTMCFPTHVQRKYLADLYIACNGEANSLRPFYYYSRMGGEDPNEDEMALASYRYQASALGQLFYDKAYLFAGDNCMVMVEFNK